MAFLFSALLLQVGGQEPVTELQSELKLRELKVWPNPSDGEFHISFLHKGQEKVEIKLYDMTGRLLHDLSDEKVEAAGRISVEVDLPDLKSGLHFIRIKSGTASLTRKILIK